MNRDLYSINRPASWYGGLWREALPIGNGLTGALIPGAIADEKIIFTRHDRWHKGNPGENMPDVSDTFREMRESIEKGDYAAANRENLAVAMENKGYMPTPQIPYPFGWLTIRCSPESMFRHYRRGIDMRTGEAFVDYEIGDASYHRRAFISRKSDIAVLRFLSDRPLTAVFGFRLADEPFSSVITERSISLKAEKVKAKAAVSFAGDIVSKVKDGEIEVTGSDFTVIIKCSSVGRAADISAYVDKPYDALLKKHAALHARLYDSVSIELADDPLHAASNGEMLDQAYDGEASPALLERIWRFGRYLFISAASEKGNPVPLYGLWAGEDNLPWAQYVANENVEMTYWHAPAGGLAYSLPPLIRYYLSHIEQLRENARKLFGVDGIWVSAYTTPDVFSPCVNVGVIVNWISCAGWLSGHFWNYYLYTGDEKTLREEILPFMYETAKFYRGYAVERNGKVSLIPSVSPENSPSNLHDLETVTRTGHHCPVVKNATMDFAVMKELLTNLLDGIKATGMYSDEADSFQELLSKIPDYQINRDGAVKEWMSGELSDNYKHRHLSHIYPVFPGGEITGNNNPELFAAFRRAVELRELGSQSGWSLTHMANIYARFGESEKAAECLDIMAKSVVNSALLTVHNDWRGMGMTLNWPEAPIQLDAAFGAVSAIQEMLFRWEKSAISILPACPERFGSGKVRGIVFPGGHADIEWKESGSVSVTLTADRDIETDLIVRGRKAGKAKIRAGGRKTWEFGEAAD